MKLHHAFFALLSPALLTSAQSYGSDPDPERPCGFRIAPCPAGQTCVRTDPSCTRGENCAGLCRAVAGGGATTSYTPNKTLATTTTARPPRHTYESCGGHRAVPKNCPDGYSCVDDPYRGGCGQACDMPGICVKLSDCKFCGGFAGRPCEGEKKCMDDPRDSCDTRHGGADCGGLCV